MLSGWFGSKKPEEAQVTPHQAQRQKQIDSLKQQHKKILEVVKDSSYRVPFNVGAQTFFLDINLTIMFPRDPPSLQLVPWGQHPWVEANGTINSPKMAAFSMHSDLGRLVTEIIEEFQRNPPLLPRDIPPSESMPGLYPSTSFPSFPLPPIPKRSDSPNTNTLPFHMQARPAEPMFNSVGDNFPDLKSMSNAQLQSLLDTKDEKLLWDKVSSTPVIASLRDEAKRLMESNKKLAEENMERKPFLEQNKAELFEKYSVAGEKRQEFDELQRQQEAVLKQYDSATLQDRLRIATADVENESEVLADDFITTKMDVDAFLHKFLEIRKLYHSRKAIEDALAKEQRVLFFP